ncbi:DUF6466 family protein [Bifidobacterium callimiconis]|uniref:Cell surface protein n=1 Tax=Bifidobacterium callimiconis TaxID=2306973 RepID=A0A430FGJ6_9BIFI|nr:DUF6466 family protein [Bifidobacterium callimiconis]MBT1176604.1 hypothetical protein [Bifidobacterium callimiconis]RSX51940.1 cell surface protein [Bifidobacterium callimiconis]
MSRATHRSHKASRQPRPPRHDRQSIASVPVRIAIVALAVVAVFAAGIMAANWSALATNNTAVNGLNATISAYNKDSPDLEKLRTAQLQTDAQFSDAQRLTVLQLPQVRATIAANAAESARLTKQIESDLKSEKNGSDSAQTANGQQGESSNNSGDSSDTDKVNKLLEQNKQKIDLKNVPDTSSETAGSDDNASAKPW